MKAVGVLLAAVVLAGAVGWAGGAEGVFVIRVVDSETGRGVPMVRLRTVNQVDWWTDSGGVVAFDEPGLLGERVFFHVWSPGYEYPKDGFGYRGVALDTRAGGEARVEVRRVEAAERLYRVTGQGIYGESVRAGLGAPLERPVLNGGVLGQDSVQRVIYRGRIYWFWGDTSRASYPLGLFRMSGATSLLPEEGGLDPAVGVELDYWVGEDGFSRAMAPVAEPGVVWLDGLCVVADEAGRERLVAHWTNLLGLTEPVKQGMAVWNDEAEVFESVAEYPLDEAGRAPQGNVTRMEEGGREYLIFGSPFPMVRAEARYEAVIDAGQWESFTPLPAGVRYEGADTLVERDAAGRLRYGWKRGGYPITPEQEYELWKAGRLRDDEVRQLPRDWEDPNEVVVLHRGSTHWHEGRGAWITIGNRMWGESLLGDVYYTESAAADGVRRRAWKVATLAPWSYYNPVHHPFFDEEDGAIYFEGTLSEMFSGADQPVPRYDYNQIMYRLDLGDVPWGED